MTTQEYLDLITSEYTEQPNFTAMVSVDVSPLVRVQELMTSMVPIFDLDTAVGEQLDIIGKWVGITRNVAIPIAGVYFTWDGTDPSVGWDYGVWQPDSAPTDVTTLPDDVYRTLIRAKIAANQWDGTTEGAYRIWEKVFPTTVILIQDNQDMSYDLIILGGIIDSLTLALITGGYIPLKPEGVRVRDYYVSTDDNRAFGWDVDSTYLGGWDDSSWLKEISPT